MLARALGVLRATRGPSRSIPARRAPRLDAGRLPAAQRSDGRSHGASRFSVHLPRIGRRTAVRAHCAVLVQKQLADDRRRHEARAAPLKELWRAVAHGRLRRVPVRDERGRSLSWVYEFWHSRNQAAVRTRGYHAADAVLDTDPRRADETRCAPRSPSSARVPRRSAGGVPRLAGDRAGGVRRSSTSAVEARPRHPDQPLAVAPGVAGQQARAMRRITSRFVLLIATAAVLPLVDLRFRLDQRPCASGTETSVSDGNCNVAKQVAEQHQSCTCRHNVARAAVGRRRSSARPALDALAAGAHR